MRGDDDRALILRLARLLIEAKREIIKIRFNSNLYYIKSVSSAKNRVVLVWVVQCCSVLCMIYLLVEQFLREDVRDVDGVQSDGSHCVYNRYYRIIYQRVRAI